MPYVERTDVVISDTEVLIKAIAKWQRDNNTNGFGLTGNNPGTDLMNILMDMIADLPTTVRAGYELRFPDMTTGPKAVSLLKATYYAYARHVHSGGPNIDIATNEVDITDPGYGLSCTDFAMYAFLMLRLFLISSALSLEGAIGIAVAFLTWQATAVGEQDNHSELYINIAGMATQFVLWIAGWFAHGSLRVEWKKTETIADKASFITSQVGTVAAASSMGVLAYLGTQADASNEIGIMLFVLIGVVLLQNNKPAILQIGKGIDVLIHIIFALFSLVGWFLGGAVGSFAAYGRQQAQLPH
ncbi:hypothetical protein TH468_10860 [Thalassospira sp. MCCC 1A03138]|nr:hypothetical protein TH468_10860 [Thalassospira sp. MCCC 1A03138]